jgi:hypothetical protein
MCVACGRGIIIVTYKISGGNAGLQWLLTSPVFCGVELFSDDDPDPGLVVTATYAPQVNAITISNTAAVKSFTWKATVKAVGGRRYCFCAL